MSFTYQIENIATNLVAQVRLRTGQTVNNGESMSDEEINFFLSQNNNDVNATVTEVLQSLLVRASQFYDKTTGEVSESKSQVFDNLREQLTNQALGSSIIPTPTCMHFGGLASDEVQARNEDKTVYHGFEVKDDKTDSTKPNCGVENLCLTESIAQGNELTVETEVSSEMWIEIGENYLFSIPQSVHKLVDISAKAFDDQETEITDVVTISDTTVTVKVTKDPDARFIGRLEIKGYKADWSKIHVLECFEES